MTKKVTNTELLTAINALSENINSLNARVTVLENGKVAPKSTTKGGKKQSAPKTSGKKSVSKGAKKSAPKQTREERLTEQYGSLEERTKWAKARTEGYQTLHEVIGHTDYYKIKSSDRNKLASKFADLRVANPKKSAKTIAKEVLA